MPVLPRKLQKIFGSALTAAGNVAVWGSYKANAPAAATFNNDLDAIQSLAAWPNGLNGSLIGNRVAAAQEFNAFMLTVTQQIAYILNRGLPDWLTTEIYMQGALAVIPGTNPPQIVYSKTDNNTGNDPATDTNNWGNLGDVLVAPGKLIHAWCNFQGNVNPIVVNDSAGIFSITENAIGDYVFYFTTVFPNTNYGWVASETQVDNTSFLDQFTRLTTDIKTNGSIEIRILNGGTSALTSSPEVSCAFFGNS